MMQLKRWIQYAGLGLIVYMMVAFPFSHPSLSQNSTPSAIDNQMTTQTAAGFGDDLMKIGPNITAAQKPTGNCEDPGEKEGWISCSKSLNGLQSEIINYQESFGNEFKRQTQITERNSKGQTLNVRTVRIKVRYEYGSEGRKKKTEYFDIVTRPQSGKITREIVLYQYDTETQKRSYASHTHYEQIGNEMFAEIQRHVVLNYDRNGNPMQGRAQNWKNQVPGDSLLLWTTGPGPSGSFDLNRWHQWEAEILSASPSNPF